MANFLSNIRNPIDDPDILDLFDACVHLGILESDDDPEAYEVWQLTEWIEEVRSENAAQDHYASFYSF